MSNGLEKYPKLRFPGFEEPWKVSRLSDFAERVTRKNTENDTELPLTISSKDGLVDQVSYFNKTVASKDMSGYYLLKRGEYAYNKSYSVGYDFGSIKRLDRYPMGALSTLYICFSLIKHDTDFIKAYFDSLKWYREIYMISAEGARNHGLLNVPVNDFFETRHYLPVDLQEQRQIADFISILERRIELQRSLVESLKKYKRGLSDMLFSSISITPNCKRILWKNVFLLLQNNTFSRDDLIQYGGTVCDIHYGDMLVKYGATVNLSSTDIPYIKPEKDISKFSINSYLQNGDIVIADTAEDYSVGKATEIISLDGIMALSGLHTIPCRPCIEFAPMYLGYYLNSSYFRRQLYPMIQGTKVSSISKSEIAKTEILVPSKLEQRRIASILYGLDQKIEYEENQTKALVHIKSAFLQQLFI